MLGLALVLFLAALSMCSIALWIGKRSERIDFDLSAGDVAGQVREMTYSLVGWLVIALMVQGWSLLFLSIVFPIVWVFS